MAKRKSRKNNKSEKKRAALVAECYEAFAQLYKTNAAVCSALDGVLATSKKIDKGAWNLLAVVHDAEDDAIDRLDDAVEKLAKALLKGKGKA